MNLPHTLPDDREVTIHYDFCAAEPRTYWHPGNAACVSVYDITDDTGRSIEVPHEWMARIEEEVLIQHLEELEAQYAAAADARAEEAIERRRGV